MESEFQMSFASLYPFPFSSDGEPDAHEHDRQDSERDGDVLEVALEGKGERGYDDAEDRSQEQHAGSGPAVPRKSIKASPRAITTVAASEP